MSSLDSIPSDLPSRIVFSLLRAPVKLAARLGLPLQTVVQLLRVAYYQQLRESHPRDRKAVASRLGVSLRTAAELQRQLSEGFLEPEDTVMFNRQVRSLINEKPQTADEVAKTLGTSLDAVNEALKALAANGWTRTDSKKRWSIASVVQSYVGGSPSRRVDGLNRQQDLLAKAAWAAFFAEDGTPDTARTWVFHADPAAFKKLRDETMSTTRQQLFDLDEEAEASPKAEQVGVSIIFCRMDE